MSPLFDLTGKRALITGASRGIGLACAQILREAGAHVTLVARDAVALDAAVRAIGDGAEAIVCDVTDVAGFRAALAPRPAFDILVNNVGINIPEPFTEVTEARFDAVFSVNVRSAFFVAQTVIVKMLEAGIGGSIINMSSQLGHVAYPGRSIYCTSKHAIEGLTKVLAIEFASKGIRVNAVAPTMIETEMLKEILKTPESREAAGKSVPLGRMGQPQDVAAAVLYLASAASGLVTGTSLKVDGGLTAQ